MGNSFVIDFIYGRKYFAAVALLILAFFGAGATKISFNTDPMEFFREGYIPRLHLDKMEHDYKPSRQIIYVVDFGSAPLFSEESLKIAAEITKALEDMPNAAFVSSITNEKYSYSDGDTLYVEKMFESPESFSKTEIEKRYAFSKSDSLIFDRLVSSSKNIAAFYVDINIPEENRQASFSKTIASAEAVKESFSTNYPSLTIYMTGDVILESSLLDVSIEDGSIMLPLVFLFSSLLLLYFVRSIKVIISGFVIVLGVVVSCAGVAGWAGWTLNQTSSLGFVLAIVVSIANVVHVLVNFVDNLNGNMAKELALAESLKVNRIPLSLNSLTTAVGFFSLNMCESPIFAMLGNIGGIGVITSYVLIFLLLPILALSFTYEGKVNRPDLRALMSKFTGMNFLYSRWFPVSIIVCLMSALPFINHIRLQDDPLYYFSTKNDFRVATAEMSNYVMSRQLVMFSIDTQKEQGVTEKEYIQMLIHYTDWLKDQPESKNIFSYLDILQRISESMDEEHSASDIRLFLENPSLASQYLLLYEMSLDYGQDLRDFLTDGNSASRVIVGTHELGNQELITFKNKCSQWLHKNYPNYEVNIAGQSTMFAELGQDIMESMIIGSLLTMALITGILAFGFRSIKFALLSLIPNILPAAFVYSLWGLLVQEVNLASAITFSISLGIIVDDTVHILSKYLSGIKNGLGPHESIEQTFRTTGPALIITSSIVFSGIAVMGLSDFAVHSIIAYITGPIIVLALFFDFATMPGILVRLTKFNSTEAVIGSEITGLNN